MRGRTSDACHSAGRGAAKIARGTDTLAHGAELDRIETIHTHLHEVVQQIIDAAAGVVEGFPACILVHPVVDLLVIRLVQTAEGGQARERTRLRAEIRA